MDVAEAIDVSPTADEERAEAARRTGARWRVVAAWARWERAGLLAHLDATAVDALRDALAAAAPAESAIQEGAALEARLEIVEAVLHVGGDGATCIAAFASTAASIDGDTLADEIARLRRRLAAPVAAEGDLAPVNTKGADAWLAIDRAAVDLRRRAAVETKDARALVAELATTAVALRRLDLARRRRVALQAVHVHLPLGELLRDLEGTEALFRDAPYRALLQEIEERSYKTLFPSSYEHARRLERKARAAVGPAGPPAFAAAARAVLAETLAASDAARRAFFPEEATALARARADDRAALALPVATLIERRLLVEVRVKTAGSALRKMLASGNTKAVRDVLGLRVVVLGETPDRDAPPESLYAVRDALNALGNELEGRFKDYVASPKPSGYRSLHATLLRPGDGLLVEVQIRSREMHWHATFGDASHAAYSVDRRDPALRGAGAKLLPPAAD